MISLTHIIRNMILVVITLFYPEYDSSRSLHLARLPRTMTFWNSICWLTPNDVSISGSLGNPYFNQSVLFFGYLQYKVVTPKLK